uniref:Plasmid stabilization system protein ParE n=1 Tax=Candidatus Kentrum sp. DK TaxID=2126562 RepID=A0A450TKL1_9GAMM|nr:MAG: Plasmid stabilization system protein ParE [Candidatus Kentron sp. DK]
MTEIIISEKAERDLSGIIGHISLDNRARAETFVEELLDKSIDVLSVFPLSSPIQNKELNVRRFVYRKYNIYYRYDETSNIVTILHVLHSALAANKKVI